MDYLGVSYYLIYDQVGSLRVLSDTLGNEVKSIRYDSYGNILEESNPSMQVPFGFAGGLYDRDTGLIRFGYRDYDPQTGKWTAKDPIGFNGGDTSLYGYVLNDPVNGFDPTGLLPFDDAGQQSLTYWVNQAMNNNSLYYIPAFFAALWTPSTSVSTLNTLSLPFSAARLGAALTRGAFYGGTNNAISQLDDDCTQFNTTELAISTALSSFFGGYMGYRGGTIGANMRNSQNATIYLYPPRIVDGRVTNYSQLGGAMGTLGGFQLSNEVSD